MSDKMLNILYQSHTGSWLILVIAFLLSCLFLGQKITPMILRLFYLIMLGSGIGMLIGLNFPIAFIIKGILAVILIGIMEMIVGRRRRGQPTVPFWIAFIILLAVVVLMGFHVISF